MWSETKRAQADDDDLAKYRERKEGPNPSTPPPPRITEWTLADELIATITDAANAIRITIAQANTEKGKKAPQFKPSRRPLTAHERAEKRRDRETVADIVALALPHRE